MRINFITCCFLLISCTVWTQVEIDKEWKQHSAFYQSVFIENDPDFDIQDSSEEFKDSPVVILSQKLYIGFFAYLKPKFAKNKAQLATGQIKGIIRKRIKIQQESAIADFSTFYFGKSEVVGITLIKMDGSQQKIDLQKAIPNTTEVPSVFRSNFKKINYYKIAIPNLMVGDILDFHTTYREDYLGGSFSALMSLSSSYPIMNNNIWLDFSGKWSFYHTGINNANKFIEVASGGVDIKGNPIKKVRRFALNQKEIAAQIDKRWDYPYLNDPTIKMITFKQDKPKIASDINFTAIPAAEYTPNNYGAYDGPYTFNLWGEHDTKEFKYWKTMSKADGINEVYYYLRYLLLPSSGKPLAELETSITNQDNFVEMTDKAFVANFRGALNNLGVQTELVYAIPKYYGTIEKALATEEVAIGVYVRAVDKYFFAPNNFSKPGGIPTYLNEAKVLRVASNGQEVPAMVFAKAKKIELPKYGARDNLFKANLTLEFSADLMEQSGIVNFSFTNEYRQLYANLFLNNLTYRKEDARRFPFINKSKKEQKQEVAIAKKAEEEATEREKIRWKAIKKHFAKDYSIKELTACKVLNDGRYGEEPLAVTIEFTAENLIKKAGSNYIFSVGRLIGEQIKLEKEEIAKRVNDIHFTTAKLIANTIEVKIPTGYKVDGLNNLTFAVHNEFMAFGSEAEVKDNILTITTNKAYKKATVPKKEWPQIVATLEAAYKFTQAKIVLKPLNQRDTLHFKEK